MTNVISDIIKCLTEIYFVIGIFSLFMLLRHKKETFFLFFVVFTILLMERSLFDMLSYRYFAVFIILFFILFVFLLNKNTFHSKKKRFILFFFLMVSVCYNSFKCFHASRNNYIFDVKESIEKKLTDNSHTTVLVDNNEIKRLFVPTQSFSKQKELVRFPTMPEDFNAVFAQYSFWADDAFLYTKESLSSDRMIQFHLEKHDLTLKKTENFLRYNKKVFSVYRMDKLSPSVFSCPELRNDPFTNNVLEKGTIKSGNPVYDTYIFQFNNQLVWFIGAPITKQTGIIYHIYTDRLDLLPPRTKTRFENRGFRVGNPCEIGVFGPYRVFAKNIPTEYPVTKINVGFNTAENIVWFKSIQASND